MTPKELEQLEQQAYREMMVNSSVMTCHQVPRLIARVRMLEAQLRVTVDALDDVLGTDSDMPSFDATYDAAEVLVEAYRAEHGPRGAP